MEQSAIAEKIRTAFPDEVLDLAEHQGQTAVLLKPGRILDILGLLRNDPDLSMNHLRALCGVDNSGRDIGRPERFEVVYQLYSTGLRHDIRLRVLLPENEARLASATAIWPGCDWLEREVYDMFGIRFDGHPNLKRVLLPEDWDGHPLLKDYPLRGRTEWPELAELKEKAARLEQHDFYGRKAPDPDLPEDTDGVEEIWDEPEESAGQGRNEA